MLTARMQRISFVVFRSRLGLGSTPTNCMTHAEGICGGGVIWCKMDQQRHILTTDLPIHYRTYGTMTTNTEGIHMETFCVI